MFKRFVTRFDKFQLPHQFAIVIFVAIVSLFGLFALAVSQTGCHDVCVQTAPARATASILIDDAQTSLQQALVVVTQINNPEMREKALVALNAAVAALRASEKALHGAETACTSPDIDSIFKDFVAAWKILAPFLSLLGGPSAGSQVATPLVVQGVR
jgi:hypothetical protein